jgi:hypothetical protein
VIPLPGCFDKVVIRPRRLTTRWLLLPGALAVLSVAAWVSAIAGAGSGTATITPSAPVAAGSSAKWSIQYRADEAIKNGRVRVTIPAGWTAPASSSSSSAGYVTVSTDEPAGAPVLSVSSQNITVDVDTLSVGNTITILYGDDSGSVNGRATAVTGIGSYPFIVASDPSGTSVSPIASSPSLTVVAATPDHIEIAPSDTTVVAGTFAQYRLIVRDQYGNRAPVASSRSVNLFTSSGAFYSPSNHGATISNISISGGDTSVRVDYKGTLASPAGSCTASSCPLEQSSPSLAGSDDVNVSQRRAQHRAIHSRRDIAGGRRRRDAEHGDRDIEGRLRQSAQR